MDFNPSQWAKDHERLDAERFRNIDLKVSGILRVLGIGGACILALLGWSLKAQYDTMSTQIQTSQVQLQALHDLKAQVGVPTQVK